MVVTPAIKVQHFELDLGASENTLNTTIEEVPSIGTNGAAFAFITSVQCQSSGVTAGSTSNANYQHDDVGLTCWLHDTTTLKLQRESSGNDVDYKAFVQVWSYEGPPGGADEFIVRSQQNEVLMVDTVKTLNFSHTSGSFTVSDFDDVVVIQCGLRGGQTAREFQNIAAVLRFRLSGSTYQTQLTKGPASTGGPPAEPTESRHSFAVVEFTGSNWSAQRSDFQTWSSAGVDEEMTITSVGSWRNAMIFSTKNQLLNGNNSIGWTARPGSSATKLAWRLRSTVTDPSDHRALAYIVWNTGGDLIVHHGSSMDGDFGSLPAGTASPQSETFAIPDISSGESISLECAGVIYHAAIDGTGNAYGRAWWGCQLTELSDGTAEEFETWRGRHVLEGEHSIQVIEFPKFNLIEPDPVQIELTIPAETLTKRLNVDPVEIDLTVVDPDLAKRVNADPVQIELGTTQEALSKRVRPDAVAAELSLLGPNLTKRLNADPVLVELTIPVANLSKVVTPDAVLLELSAVDPGLTSRIRPDAVVIELSLPLVTVTKVGLQAVTDLLERLHIASPGMVSLHVASPGMIRAKVATPGLRSQVTTEPG